MAQCRIRVGDRQGEPTVDNTPINDAEISAEMRSRWAKEIADRYGSEAAASQRQSISDWDLVLYLDGSVDNAANPPTLSPAQDISTAAGQQRIYPAHYRIPSTIIERFNTDPEKISRTELFALGCLLYELSSSTKPFDDRTDEEVQALYAAGEFPDDVWSSPISIGILRCWCPEFAAEMRQPLPGGFNQYISKHPGLFALQVVGGVASIASLVAFPILGAVGFAATGPVAGSAAAAWQSSMGLVSAGSLFSWCQSAAMGGAAVGGIIAAGASGATVATAASLYALECWDEKVPAPVLKEKFLAAWNRHSTSTETSAAVQEEGDSMMLESGVTSQSS